MNIPCTHCLTPNEVMLPPANPDGKLPSISVRCSACGSVFSTETIKKKRSNPWDAPEADFKKSDPQNRNIEPPKRVPPAAASYPHQPKYAPPEQPTYTVNQDGDLYQVQDLAAIQRWIVENRLTREGKISTDGQWWDRLGDRPEFKSFFEMLDRIHALETRPEPVIQRDAPPPIQADPVIKELRSVSPREDLAFTHLEREPSIPVASPSTEEFEFSPPATEEIPFDEPRTDEHAITTSVIAQQPTSEPIFAREAVVPTPTPVVEAIEEQINPSIYDQYPTFSDTDLPTEEELQIASAEPEETNDDAFIGEDWPTEQIEMTDDLDWVSSKQKKQRVFLGLVLVMLIGLTAKTLLGMQSTPPGTESELNDVASVDVTDPDEQVEGDFVGEEAESDEIVVEENSTVADEPATPAIVEVEQPTTQASRSRASTTQAPAVRRSPPPPREPETADSFITSGRESMSEGDYRSARFAFLEAVAIEPQNPEANHGLAFAAHRQEDIPFAMRYYCRALSLSSSGSALASEILSSLASLHLECEE